MTTLLQGVNAVLKRHGLINGITGELASLTNPAIQRSIDLAISAWNEAVIDIYSIARKPMPNEVGSGTITLATSDRDYSLATDLVQLRWPLIDTTNNQVIDQYEGGYEKMRRDQTNPGSYTGLPNFAAIRPTDGLLFMDRIPTAAENGKQYGYIYDKSLILSLAADNFPFNTSVYQMMILPVTELVRRELRNTFDKGLYDKRMADAAGLLTNEIPEASYMPDRIHGGMVNTDPLYDGD